MSKVRYQNFSNVGEMEGPYVLMKQWYERITNSVKDCIFGDDEKACTPILRVDGIDISHHLFYVETEQFQVQVLNDSYTLLQETVQNMD